MSPVFCYSDALALYILVFLTCATRPDRLCFFQISLYFFQKTMSQILHPCIFEVLTN